MSLNLHEEAVSNIVAYDSNKTSTVDDTESGLGGCYAETNRIAFDRFDYSGNYYGESDFCR